MKTVKKSVVARGQWGEKDKYTGEAQVILETLELLRMIR